MNWSKSRQFFIWFTIGSIVLLVIGSVVFAVIYKVPSCGDGVQNQDEKGIDCGGSCAKVCSFEAVAPVVDFVRPLSAGAGRTDIIAYVENRNESAGVAAAKYTLELYDANNDVVAKSIGTMKLPPSSRPTPLFVPAAYLGTKTVTHAFLTFDDGIDWQAAKPTPRESLPGVSVPVVSSTDTLPKIKATIHNPQPISLLNLKVVIAVFDANNSVVAASQTLLREVPAQGDADATFTWNEAFPSSYSKIEVIPLYP